MQADESVESVDTRALKALKRSPLTLDLYALCCYESYRVQKTRKPRFIAWRSLMLQLGSDYEGKRAQNDFPKECIKALRKIQAVMPSLRVEIVEGGLEVQN